jgi:hypothetical protein
MLSKEGRKLNMRTMRIAILVAMWCLAFCATGGPADHDNNVLYIEWTDGPRTTDFLGRAKLPNIQYRNSASAPLTNCAYIAKFVAKDGDKQTEFRIGGMQAIPPGSGVLTNAFMDFLLRAYP